MKFPKLKVNRELLRIKLFYFLLYAGLSPIFAYIPTIAKDLGFSTVSIGWIYTASPVVLFFVKPTLGSLADKYKKQKLIFFSCMVFTIISLFSLQFLPSLKASPRSAYLNCTQGAVCLQSGNFNHPKNTLCKVSFLDQNQGKIYINITLGSEILSVNESLNASVGFYSKEEYNTENICLSLEPSQYPEMEVVCGQEQTTPLLLPVEVACGDSLSLTDSQILAYYQFWLLLVILVTVRVSVGTASTLCDSICLHVLGDKSNNYGLQRMWAGIGWGLIALSSSIIIDAYSKDKPLKDYTISYYIMLGFFSLNLLNILGIKMTVTIRSKNLLNDVSEVLKDPKICIFLLWCFTYGCYTSIISNYLFWYLEDLDASLGNKNLDWLKTLEGLISLIQTLGGEVPMFFLAGWVLKKLGHVNAMTVSLFAFGIRYFLYSILSDPWLMLPIETLHGFCYGLSYTTMTTYAKTIARPGTEFTVQSLVSVFSEGAGYSAGSLFGGYMVKAIGYTTTFSLLSASAGTLGVGHLIITKLPNLPCYSGGLKLKQGINLEATI